MSPDRLVIDLGNTRVKWGRLDAEGRVVTSLASAVDDPRAWEFVIDRLVSGRPSEVAIASVNPGAADRLGAELARRGVGPIRWFRSAADVSVRHWLDAPERTGVDRALAVLAASRIAGRPGPGIVVQCGTAITVERIGPDGVWQGGAIAIGPGLAARALRSGTAQLPEAAPLSSGEPPPAWGASTMPALDAGIVWGAVGAIRELIARQADRLVPAPWVIWTGGDAPALAPLVGGDSGRIEPELVLIGLAAAAFGAPIGPDQPIDAAAPTR